MRMAISWVASPRLASALLPHLTRLSFRSSTCNTSHLLPKHNAQFARSNHTMDVTSSLNPNLAAAARSRARARLNQQRMNQEIKPPVRAPDGVPSHVPVHITNVFPTGLPAHHNAPRPAYVLLVSATGNPHSIGDCPFSQCILMTLEEKNLPYEGRFIDVENKPNWFVEMYPEGKVPLMLIDQKWVADVDVILELVEQKVSIPTFRTPPEKASVGLNIFPLFIKFLRSKDSTDRSEQTLIQELRALNEHLKTEDAAYKNPFVNGRFMSMIDTNLAPKLYHMDVALRHIKNWELPSDLNYVDAYMKKLFIRPSFTKTKPPESLVIRGWEKDLGRVPTTSDLLPFPFF